MRARLDSQKEEKKLAHRTYEVMYIIDPEVPADRVEKLNEAVGKVIEKEGGTVVHMDDIGRSTLAYPIDKKTEGPLCAFRDRRIRTGDPGA